jgi:hypothetical protein
MARFHDMLSSLGVGEDGVSVAYPETFTDDITAAYDEDFSVPTAKIGVLETELAEANAKIAELKAHNYDLLMQVPAAVTPDAENTEDEPEDEPSEDEPSDIDKVFSD